MSDQHTAGRTYDQMCPVAASLDVLGDRWTILILRDLLWWGPQRFGELLEANPGLSPTLLTTRIRQLAEDGLILRIKDSQAYGLTDTGRASEPIIEAMYRYGARLLVESDATQRRLTYLVRLATRDPNPKRVDPNISGRVTIRVGGAALGLRLAAGNLEIVEPTGQADLIVDLPDLIALATRQRSLDDLGHGAWSGDRDLIEAVLSLLEPPIPYTVQPPAPA